ncbi:MAG: hypothetical protein R3D02_16365 [Hyphomicrobiales bacterium]
MPRIEGLSPRVAALFARHGLDPRALGIGPRVTRRAFWSGTAENRYGEHLVERRGFDRALRQAASNAGAHLVTSQVKSIETGDEGCRVLCLENGERIMVRRAIDARTARAGRVRAGARAGDADGRLRLSSNAASAATTTVPCRDGWLWHADFGDGRAWLQASFDGKAEAGGADLAGRVEAMLGSDEARAAFGCRLSCPDDLVARNADTVLAAPDLDPSHIRIGDAAVAHSIRRDMACSGRSRRRLPPCR